jgi:hypothetical protein
MIRVRSAAWLLSLALVLPVTACDDLGPGADRSVSVSFSVPQGGASGRAAALVAADTFSDGTHRIDLQSVDVTFSRIVIEGERMGAVRDDDDDTDTDTDHDGLRDHSLRVGATTVSLPLQGGVITPISARLPDGTYEEIKLLVAFVRARGTFDGQPFDLTVPVNSKLEMDIDPPFVVDSDDDRLNVTVTIDLRSWFLGNGTLVDPRQVQLSETLQRTLQQRVRASFRAFEDSDRDADDADTDTDTDRGGHSGRR